MNQNFNNFNQFGTSQTQTPSLTLGKYTAKTFGWMCAGLMITFITAFLLAFSGLAITLFSIPFLSIILAVVQIGVVISMSARINHITASAATGLFLTYSVLTGVTFSTLFYAYSLESILGVFLLTSLYFGALAAYGYNTNADLSKLGPILVSGVIFLIIASILLMFFPIAPVDRAICLLGIVIFLGFTAYDTQKVVQQYYAYQGNSELLAKASVISALTLYLDFINLFLYLLRFMNSRNNK